MPGSPHRRAPPGEVRDRWQNRQLRGQLPGHPAARSQSPPSEGVANHELSQPSLPSRPAPRAALLTAPSPFRVFTEAKASRPLCKQPRAVWTACLKTTNTCLPALRLPGHVPACSVAPWPRARRHAALTRTPALEKHLSAKTGRPAPTATRKPGRKMPQGLRGIPEVAPPCGE